MSVLQVLIVTASLLVLYRVLLKTIGVKQLGVWSLVMATTSLAQLANLGFAAGVTKFVAKYAAREEHETASRVIQTAVLTLAVLTGTFFVVVYPLAKWILSVFIPIESLKAGLSVLPYAFIAFWMLIVTGAFQAGLDGYQRIDARNLVVIGCSVVYLGLCVLFAPIWGLVGVAFASVLQNLLLLLVTCYVLKRYLPSLPIVRYSWDKALFREMLGYGTNFQLISLTFMLYEPTTKALLSKFGGLAAVGYYEMANRMVQQVRGLIATPAFSLVPAIADLKERAANRIAGLYLKSYSLVFCLAVAAYALVIMYSPVVSLVWIGHFEPRFVLFSCLLSLGWFLNLLAVPSYFANLGQGELSWNLIGHATTAVLNVVTGYVLGLRFGGPGVVVGWAFPLASGSAVMAVNYHVRNGVPLSRLLPRPSIILSVIGALGVWATYVVFRRYMHAVGGLSVLVVDYAVFSLALVLALWLHPSRKQVFGLFTGRVA